MAKMVYLLVEGKEEHQKATHTLKAAIAEALGVSLDDLDFGSILEEERPSTNAKMWDLVEEIGAIGVTDCTLPIYTRLARGGKFYAPNPETGKVEKVTGLKLEFGKKGNQPNG